MKKRFKDLCPMLAAAFSAIIALSGIPVSAISMRDRATAFENIEEYKNSTHLVTGELTEVDSRYAERGVIVQGKFSYDEGGAEDPIFGVGVDAVMLVRISEMYQWTKDGGEYVKEWSEELIDTGDASHANPTQYPLQSASGFYGAHNIKVGPYKVANDLISTLPSREKLEKLPDVDVSGFRTVGGYITNAENPDSPEIGDVRVRFEYMTATEVTVSGVQRDENIETWFATGTNRRFYAIFEGRIGMDKVIASYRRGADAPSYPMLTAGAVLSLGGAVLTVLSLMKFFGYKPTLTLPGGKKKKKTPALEGVGAGIVYAVTAGVLFVFVGTSFAFIGTMALLTLAAAVLLAVYFLFAFVPNVRRNTPKRKKDDYYEPIIRRRDEFDRRK